MRRNRGDKQDLQSQLFRLKEENDRLRQIALTVEQVERIKQENKKMRIEMQKLMSETGLIQGGSNQEDEEEDENEEELGV